MGLDAGVVVLAIPFMCSIVLLEFLLPGGKKRFRLNDSVSSLSAGMISICIGTLSSSLLSLPFNTLRARLVSSDYTKHYTFNLESLLVALVLVDLVSAVEIYHLFCRTMLYEHHKGMHELYLGVQMVYLSTVSLILNSVSIQIVSSYLRGQMFPSHIIHCYLHFTNKLFNCYQN
jgi:hypothetical protein